MSVNMRGTGESRGWLDGITAHDLAVDVAGVLDAMDCGPAHGSAMPSAMGSFAVWRRTGLAGAQRDFACCGWSHRTLNATRHALSQRYRSQDERQRSRHRAGRALAVAGVGSENTCAGRMLAGGVSRPPRDQPGYGARRLVGRRNSPVLVIQGLDDEAAPPGNGTRSASNSASASGLSTCLVRDTFCCWSSPKPLSAPLPSLSALAQYPADCLREMRGVEMARYDDTFVDRFRGRRTSSGSSSRTLTATGPGHRQNHFGARSERPYSSRPAASTTRRCSARG